MKAFVFLESLVMRKNKKVNKMLAIMTISQYRFIFNLELEYNIKQRHNTFTITINSASLSYCFDFSFFKMISKFCIDKIVSILRQAQD